MGSVRERDDKLISVRKLNSYGDEWVAKQQVGNLLRLHFLQCPFPKNVLIES